MKHSRRVVALLLLGLLPLTTLVAQDAAEIFQGEDRKSVV